MAKRKSREIPVVGIKQTLPPPVEESEKRLRKKALEVIRKVMGENGETLARPVEAELTEAVLEYWRNLPEDRQKEEGVFIPRFTLTVSVARTSAKAASERAPEEERHVQYANDWEKILKRIIRLEADMRNNLPRETQGFISNQRAILDRMEFDAYHSPPWQPRDKEQALAYRRRWRALFQRIKKAETAYHGLIPEETQRFMGKQEQDINVIVTCATHATYRGGPHTPTGNFPTNMRPRVDVPFAPKVLAIRVFDILRTAKIRSSVKLTFSLLDALGALPSGFRGNRDALFNWRREVENFLEYNTVRL